MKFLLLADASSPHSHRWASSIRSSGHEVILASLEPPLDGEAVVLPSLSNSKLKYLLSLPSFRKLAKEQKADVLFAHFLPNYGLIGSLLNVKKKILALWGSDILIWAFKTPMHRALAKCILKSYDLILADAQFVADILRKHFGLPEERIFIIPFGVSKDVLSLPLKSLPEEPLHFVSVRRHEPLFNHIEILNFLKLVSLDFPIRITYLQEGSQTDAIRKEAEKLNLDVHFTGRLTYARYLELLRDAHFCISVPNRDATSVSLLECMALGAVPIVSDIPANREWVREGVISPPKASEMYVAFKRVYNRKWWERARHTNRELILKKCNWEENLQKFLHLAKSLTSPAYP